MGSIWIKEFTGGLDTRRLPETTPGGLLIRGQDGHITRGGEFEKRAAFVPFATLPGGTVGLARTRTSLVTFGSAPAPAMPNGVVYQRLQHPDGVTALARVPSYDLYDGRIYAVGEFEDGSVYHFYDGVRVTDWFDGRARASFRVISGGAGAELTALTVNGVAAISAPVAWAGSAQATAAAIAAAVNSTASAPEYTATAVGDRVNIVASLAGAAANGRTVAAVVAGGLTLGTTNVALADGADSATAFTPGTFVQTLGSKLYSTSASLLHFSGIQQPTEWTTDAAGAGFINMATQNSGSEELTCVARYQDFLAVFSAEVVQIWFVDPDPTLNTQRQVLSNTGTQAPLSVARFGDNDIFYLDGSGVRSLRARDSSNAAATSDIGVPIDELVQAKLAALTDAERRAAIGLINPIDKRFWLILRDEIFVFSFFANARVSAWTTYRTTAPQNGGPVAFNVDAAAVFAQRVYLRAGNTIYVYGGVSGAVQYDTTAAEAWLPYLDANRPAARKEWEGIDAALLGTWEISAAMQPTDAAAEEIVARVARTTYNLNRISFQAMCSHVSLRFRSQGPGRAVLSAAVLHFRGDEDED
jgi:hypothetical protein